MRYHCIDDKVFESDNYEDLAHQLWKSQFGAPPTIEEWMVGFARRAEMWDGSILRTDTVMHLMEDAVARGLIERLPDVEPES